SLPTSAPVTVPSPPPSAAPAPGEPTAAPIIAPVAAPNPPPARVPFSRVVSGSPAHPTADRAIAAARTIAAALLAINFILILPLRRSHFFAAGQRCSYRFHRRALSPVCHRA